MKVRVTFRAIFFWRHFSTSRAVRLREALEELGPIFVKFGQLLSTRPDLVPADIANEKDFTIEAFGKAHAATRGARVLYDAKMQRLKS